MLGKPDSHARPRVTRRGFLITVAGSTSVAACTTLRREPSDGAGVAPVLLDWAGVPRVPARWRLARVALARGDAVFYERLPGILDVVRTRDQLFARVGLRDVEASGVAEGKLLVRPKSDAARVGLLLPPQSFAEQAYRRLGGPRLTDFDPDRDRSSLLPAGESLLLAGLPSAGVLLEAADIFDAPSRALRTVHDVLRARTSIGKPKKWLEDLGDVSVLELPFGVLVSPVEPSRLVVASAQSEDRRDGWRPIWFAQLHGFGPAGPCGKRSVKMVCLPPRDDVPGVDVVPLPSAHARRLIFEQTAEWLEESYPGPGPRPEDPVVETGLEYSNLALSSDGASTDVDGEWVRELDCEAPPPALDEWKHRIRGGRVHFAKESYVGWFCLGHQASLQRIRRRVRAETGDGRTSAPVIEEWRVQCRDEQPVSYPFPDDGVAEFGRDWCFASADLAPEQSPPIVPPEVDGAGKILDTHLWIRRLDTGMPLLYSVRVVDRAGREYVLQLPMLWISDSAARERSEPFDVYNASDPALRTLRMGGENCALVPLREQAASGDEARGLLQVLGLQLTIRRGCQDGPDLARPSTWQRPVFPSIERLELEVPELAAFEGTGRSESVLFGFHRSYLKHGFEPAVGKNSG